MSDFVSFSMGNQRLKGIFSLMYFLKITFRKGLKMRLPCLITRRLSGSRLARNMSGCHHNHSITSSVYQTLDELDFERGIWSAAQSNDLPKVLELIMKGVDVNSTDRNGYTALHYASRNGHFELCKLLLSHKADVNLLTKAGRASSLHRTASAGHKDVFELLLKSGAKTNLKDSDGKTVLHRAAEANQESIVRIILEVDPDLLRETDNKGRLPIDLSASDSIKNILRGDPK